MTQLKYNSHPIPPMSCYVKLGILCPLSPGGGSKFFIPMNIFKPLWNAKRQILFSLLYKWSTKKLNILLKATQLVFITAGDKPVRHLRGCALKSQAFLGNAFLPGTSQSTHGSTQRAWSLARKGEPSCGQGAGGGGDSWESEA